MVLIGIRILSFSFWSVHLPIPIRDSDLNDINDDIPTYVLSNSYEWWGGKFVLGIIFCSCTWFAGFEKHANDHLPVSTNLLNVFGILKRTILINTSWSTFTKFIKASCSTMKSVTTYLKTMDVTSQCDIMRIRTLQVDFETTFITTNTSTRNSVDGMSLQRSFLDIFSLSCVTFEIALLFPIHSFCIKPCTIPTVLTN